jgi:hypothetical protein
MSRELLGADADVDVDVQIADTEDRSSAASSGGRAQGPLCVAYEPEASRVAERVEARAVREERRWAWRLISVGWVWG